MPEEQYGYEQQYFSDLNTRIRDIEEKQRLLKDRTLIIGSALVEEREKTFQEIQEMKKTIAEIKEENFRLREILQRVTEQLSNTARKADFEILQRQLDILRK